MSESQRGPIRRVLGGVWDAVNFTRRLVFNILFLLIVFVVVTLPYFEASRFEPFMPYGFSKNGPPGAEVGVMAAAAIIFFAFYGFDAIATAAEEAKNPGRDRSIGIVGSMFACVIIYLAVAGGWAVPPVLNGCGTHLRAGFGGHQGRALRAGDSLAMGAPSAAARSAARSPT